MSISGFPNFTIHNGGGKTDKKPPAHNTDHKPPKVSKSDRRTSRSTRSHASRHSRSP